MFDERRKPSIGELYSKITVSSEDFSAGERRLEKMPDHPFVALCKKLYALSPSLGKKGSFNEDNRQAVAFLKWKLSAQEFTAACAISLILFVAAAFLLGTIVLYFPLADVLALLSGGGMMTYIYAYLPFILIAMFAVNYFSSFPASEARREQTKALTYVPELLGYMVMSIKLVPNLEKAVEFAAQHGKGKIAKDFRELIWNVQVGMYNSLSEGLDALAYSWGKYSDEFKRALMRIRASVIENTEAKRYALLDQTMTEMLESIRTKMEQYARDLSQPSTMLFYIGVLLPLLLIIILPVGSSFSNAPLANPYVLLLIYNIVIPAITIAFAYNLLQTRPPTYEPPLIPDSHEGLPKKWKANILGIGIDVRMAAAIVAILGLSISFVVSTQGLPPKFAYSALGLGEKTPQLVQPDKSRDQALIAAGHTPAYFALDESGELFRELMSRGMRASGGEEPPSAADIGQQIKAQEQLFFSQSKNDIAPYSLVFGLLITISLTVFILLYYTSIYKRRIQLEVQELESEFKDSLYVLASRMGENKPVEDAMKHVIEFLPDMKVSRLIFGRTLDNIKLMGMPLEQAVFDQNMGSVAKIPSALIKGSMKMLVDSVQLGVNVAARTLISLSIQLQNAQKVTNMLKILVSDVTGTMKTMTLFIAPIVLGITTSLQRVVIVTISSIAASGISSGSDNLAAGASGSLGSFTSLTKSGLISPSAIANIASPTQFILIVALYILELVVIMTYFTTKIEEDNDLLVRINIATYLPIAVITFVVSMVLSNMLVGSL
ncbi:MAG TPA: hypothetical protein HA254_03995 [Candidatus Diapherotrites archaeon]|uniref:Uncharacterized protein n=1 Tax=Candidatus Iainarchaeum sp. TaxID=3101447 RepID=A0A7J4J3J7_9ARCH|nr:hypothetical protein [Candidatus Diapherotrites archaeon]